MFDYSKVVSIDLSWYCVFIMRSKNWKKRIGKRKKASDT